MTLNCSRFLITQNKGDTMSIVEKLTGLISEVTQLERDNKTLNEQLLELEKDKSEGYKSFNTETHILVGKEFLKDTLELMREASSSAGYAYDEAQGAESQAGEASYSIKSVRDEIRELSDSVEEKLEEADKEEGGCE